MSVNPTCGPRARAYCTRPSLASQPCVIFILTCIYVLYRLMVVDMKNGTQAEVLSKRFQALADPNRLRILEMLRKPGCCAIDRGEGMCACDIEQKLELSQPTNSHHMKVLRDAGLVEAEKVGQWMWYRRNEEALRELALTLHQKS